MPRHANKETIRGPGTLGAPGLSTEVVHRLFISLFGYGERPGAPYDPGRRGLPRPTRRAASGPSRRPPRAAPEPSPNPPRITPEAFPEGR